MVTLPNLSCIMRSVPGRCLWFTKRYSDSVVIEKKMSNSSLISSLPLHTALAWFRLHCHVCLQAENDFLGGLQDWLGLDSSGGVDLVEEADEPWALGVLTWECLKMDEEEDILEALVGCGPHS